jgi:hypothetical protein
MGLIVPTPDEVRQMFAQAVTRATGATHQLHRQDFARHLRGAPSLVWQQPASGVHRLPVGKGVSLVRAQLRVTIDDHSAGQPQALRGQIDALAARLADLVPPGARVSVAFEFPAPRPGPGGPEVDCLVRAVVEG